MVLNKTQKGQYSQMKTGVPEQLITSNKATGISPRDTTLTHLCGGDEPSKLPILWFSL